MTIPTKLDIKAGFNLRNRDLVINAIFVIYSRLDNYFVYLAKVINKKFILDQAALNVSSYLKVYLRKYLYAKVIYLSGRSAWVWSNYVSVLPQARTEWEALNSPPVPMAWVWSRYRPYLGFMTINSDIRTDDQSNQLTLACRTEFKQKKGRFNKTKNQADQLTLVFFGAVIAIILI